jgi:hypothetical protein
MNITKKYLVAPYVQNLEKPSESHLENLNKNMTDIIQDKLQIKKLNYIIKI